MTVDLDLRTLFSAYNHGRLVPFIGSGMSVPACRDWKKFVENLESESDSNTNRDDQGALVQRAFHAIQKLRVSGASVSQAIRRSIYTKDANMIPESTKTLASNFWPLICTTNYDDVYLRAKLSHFKERNSHTYRKENLPHIRVLGRSDKDCRQVLRHLSFPSGEMIWALQGFLTPRDQMIRMMIQPAMETRGPGGADPLEKELVVGHSEYRKAAHRAPHFRRCFAELFRSRSLLFLGSGLGEPYFLTLFDEIIELTGPPPMPHFAVVEEGKIDPEFMQRQYHVMCKTFPKLEYGQIEQFLDEFASHYKGERPRQSAWGFRASTPLCLSKDTETDDLTVVRGTLPKPDSMTDSDAVAISCGRRGSNCLLSLNTNRRGQILRSSLAEELGIPKDARTHWLSDWVVRWEDHPRTYGIVARDLLDKKRSSRDRRNPDVIITSFKDFLRVVGTGEIRRAHVQLLSAGPKKVFQPWVSLTQMARAYGEWYRESRSQGNNTDLGVFIYVVDPSVITLLQGGYLDLSEQLAETPIRISIVVTENETEIDRYHQFANSNDKLGAAIRTVTGQRDPRVRVEPSPTLRPEDQSLQEIIDREIRTLGVVSGSTLILDYSS